MGDILQTTFLNAFLREKCGILIQISLKLAVEDIIDHRSVLWHMAWCRLGELLHDELAVPRNYII